MVRRYLEANIRNDIQKKMVFISGPRQVGKSTFARALMVDQDATYLNWDYDQHREQILKKEFPTSELVIFDEIHKYRKWRNMLKGIYDTNELKQKIVVTGSARLDYYRYGGDSLQGRYYFWRLFPLSVSECGIANSNDFEDLMKLGGFPEPFLSGSEIEARRWSRDYRTRLIREDILGIEQIRDVGTMELLMLRLPSLTGSPLSINALREDLQVNHTTVSHWLDTFERMYAIFRLLPFGAPQIRAVKKERKHYHYDWSLVDDPGARFENLVALHLMKYIAFLQDSEGRDIELRYFRDTDKREIDFVLVENGKPVQCIECKLSDTSVSQSLLYFKKRFPECDALQIVARTDKHFRTAEGITVRPALGFLQELV